MPSSPPIATIKTPWRWLTPKKEEEEKKEPKLDQAPMEQGSRPKSESENLTSYQSDPPHLAKPEPALHRLQELKSPPATIQSTSNTGPDSPGFKSRPLYRRTRSSPANLDEDGMVMGDVNGGRPTSSSGEMGSASDAPSESHGDSSWGGGSGGSAGDRVDSGGGRGDSGGGGCF